MKRCRGFRTRWWMRQRDGRVWEWFPVSSKIRPEIALARCKMISISMTESGATVTSLGGTSGAVSP